MSRQALPKTRSGTQSNHSQGDIVKLQSQLDIEKKARKDAEEKNKYLVSKIDVLHQRLTDKTTELEREQEEKEEVLKSKQALEKTIEKLEEYLRNKNPRFDVLKTEAYEPFTDPDTPRKISINTIMKTDTELEEKSRLLKKEKAVNEVLDKRVKILEKLLKENNISMENTELIKLNSEITNTELDF